MRRIVEKLKLPEGLRIPIFAGLWYSWMVKLDNFFIRVSKIPDAPLNKEKREEQVICSLTSYPARIGFVHLAIKSLMQQTYKPDRILLWLSEEQFPTKELPSELSDLVRYGLEIKWMHELFSHKKYFYPVKEQKQNELIITFDDDIIYSPSVLHRIIRTHKLFPSAVVCDRGQTINYTNIKNPGRWDTISDIGVKKPTYSMNPSPGSGCLIPYKAFNVDAVDEKLIRELAWRNDDLWYMFMCASNNTRMIKTHKCHKALSTVSGSQVEQLATINIVANQNELAIEKLSSYYPKAWERIVSDK